jgi:hypothetical protein
MTRRHVATGTTRRPELIATPRPNQSLHRPYARPPDALKLRSSPAVFGEDVNQWYETT